MQLRQRHGDGIRFAAAVCVILCFALGHSVIAQDKEPAKKAGKDSVPVPEELMLRTGSGLQLAVTYYPGSKGKESIPVVLLHGWKQNHSEYKDLAPALQKLGHAVVVPDLRGHGKSTRMKDARKDEALDATKMPPIEFTRMVTDDMDAIKDFLWFRNNAGELNIDKLCVIGAEMGASVALNFAYEDAVAQDSNEVVRPDYKLGRFVKALVLISPEQSFRGLPTRRAATYPAVQQDIAMLILVGKRDNKALQEATRIHGLFKNSHPDPADGSIDDKTLFFGRLDTSLQGTKLLDPKFDLQGIIADFIQRRLVNSDESKDWTWRQRKFPHE